MSERAFGAALAVAAASFVACLSIVFVVGAVTLVLHRAGLLRLAGLRGARVDGLRGVFADLALAAVTTCCGCATHAALHTVSDRSERALRRLAYASALRLVPCACVLASLVSRGEPLRLSFLTAPPMLLWIVLRRVGVAGALSAPSLFVARTSSQPVTRAIVDAWRETREMFDRYGAHLAVAALVAALLPSAPPSLPEPAWILVAAALPIAARFVRVDAVALAPCAVVLLARGAELAFVVPALAVADMSAVRTRRVVDAYLTDAGKAAWSRALHYTAFVIALVAAFEAWLALR